MIIGSMKSYECDGIFFRSNHDVAHYSSIETKTLPFKFTGYPDSYLNEDGQVIKVSTWKETRNYRWDLS
jgi:hypothetical protein